MKAREGLRKMFSHTQDQPWHWGNDGDQWLANVADLPDLLESLVQMYTNLIVIPG